MKTEKPEEDRKAFDARQLVLHQAAKDAVSHEWQASELFTQSPEWVFVVQVEAAQSAGGVSAFSKELNKLHKPSKCFITPCPAFLL